MLHFKVHSVLLYQYIFVGIVRLSLAKQYMKRTKLIFILRHFFKYFEYAMMKILKHQILDSQ